MTLKKFKNTELWSWIRTVFEILLLGACIMAAFLCLKGVGIAEEENYIEGYILCKEHDLINVRRTPSKKGEEIGLFQCGQKLYLDGKEKNDYMHVCNLTLELTDGWVYKGYIVFDEPVKVDSEYKVISPQRLAVRKYVDGKIIKWLKPKSIVDVVYITKEWAVTNKGFIKRKFLEGE